MNGSENITKVNKQITDYSIVGKLALVSFLFFNGFSLDAQIIFSEPFDEANTSTTGLDNTGGVSWTSACPTCTTGDYFHVNAGTLECEDTNGPATWTTANINTSSCTNGIIVSLDINLAAASNAFEECVAGCGCNCVDWISLEYNANGAGFVPLSSSEGGTCAQTCSGGTYILLGALSSGTSFSYSVCLNPTATLQLRISLQTWANGEKYQIDNVSVQCSSCALPIELVNFEAKRLNEQVELSWITATEINNDYFTIERSIDALNFEPLSIVKGAGNSNKLVRYKNYDNNPLNSAVSYYRLKQTDFSGTFSFSQVVAVQNTGNNAESEIKLIPNPTEDNEVNVVLSDKIKLPVIAEIFDYSGKEIRRVNLQFPVTDIKLDEVAKGLYFLKFNTGTNVITHKLIVR